MLPRRYHHRKTFMDGWLSLFYRFVPLLTVITVLVDHRLHADWPIYRGNIQRTGFRTQPTQAKHWSPAWSSGELEPPAPAWPAPARGSLWQRLSRIEPRVVDDQGDVPLIALDQDGRSHVLVISSSMDQLVCLDPMTGDQQWKVISDAPIRYAPHVESGVIWLGSDDGLLRSIDLSSGAINWSYRIGPAQPKVFGNGRLISSHPVRTSPIVIGDEVYAAAGLFPSQGVYAVSLRKEDGKCIWRRRLQQSPQGYLLADDQERLCIPCGRATPFCLDRQSGRFVCDLPSAGGTFCMVTKEAFFSGPGNSAAVQSYPNLPDAKMLPIGGRAIATGAGSLWFSGDGKLHCHDLKKMMARQPQSEKWTVPAEPIDQLIATECQGQTCVFTASGSSLNVFAGNDGSVLQRLSLPDRGETIRYLAMSGSHGLDTPDLLVATTASGKVFAWHGVADSAIPPPHFVSAKRDSDRSEAVSLPPITEKDRLKLALSAMPSVSGLALLIDDIDGSIAEYLTLQTQLQVISVLSSEQDRDRLRERTALKRKRNSGRGVTFLHHERGLQVPFAEPLFNLIFETTRSEFDPAELIGYAIPGSGVVSRVNAEPFIVDSKVGVGVWRHQYGTPANTSDSGDAVIGDAIDFRLQWFGGVGPSRIPDRHLRAQSPLAARSSVVLHGDDCLIGIDPANGIERWEVTLPQDAMRYVMPFDGGYSCLTIDGQTLFTAVGRELWKLDAITGERLGIFPVPLERHRMHWGYVAEQGGRLFTSLMKPTAARLQGDPKTSDEMEQKRFDPATLRKRYAEMDYGSNRPLVCSRVLCSLDTNGEIIWKYDTNSVIPNSSISLDSKGERLVMIESRGPACLDNDRDQISVEDLVKQAEVLCLDAKNGKVVWRQPIPFTNAKNVLYTLIADNKVILATSVSGEEKATYQISVMRLVNGSPLWSKSHVHVTKGLGHGEQVHHPLALRQPDGRQVLLAEPYLYDLESGDRLAPSGEKEDWTLRRPGHSCGTLSGAGQCVFFRAGNPTVLNLSAEPEKAFSKLSPSRPGCWINMLPADGRLLIPEGSASCVCAFPVQASMGFAPIRAGERRLEILEDFPSLADEPLQLQYSWRFQPEGFEDGAFQPTEGELPITAMETTRFSEFGLILDGKQWLAVGGETFDLPPMPTTVSLEASAIVTLSDIEWSGILGAIQDNGDFERGALLGIRDDHFFFAIASEQKTKMTYLQSPEPIMLGQRYHLVGTYDGKLMRLYVDGKLIAVSAAQVGAIKFEQRSCLAVGIYKDDNDHLPFHGAISEVSVFRGALSAEDVLTRASKANLRSNSNEP